MMIVTSSFMMFHHHCDQTIAFIFPPKIVTDWQSRAPPIKVIVVTCHMSHDTCTNMTVVVQLPNRHESTDGQNRFV